MKIEIEALYRCRIDYSIDDSEQDYSRPSPYELIQQEFCKLIKNTHVHASDSAGGPCWNAYVIFEGESEPQVRQTAEKTVEFIKGFKGAVFYE